MWVKYCRKKRCQWNKWYERWWESDEGQESYEYEHDVNEGANEMNIMKLKDDIKTKRDDMIKDDINDDT